MCAWRTGEVAQGLGVLAVLPEVPSSIPSDHIVAHSHLWWDLVPSSGVQPCVMCVCVCVYVCVCVVLETASRSTHRLALNFATSPRMGSNFASGMTGMPHQTHLPTEIWSSDLYPNCAKIKTNRNKCDKVPLVLRRSGGCAILPKCMNINKLS